MTIASHRRILAIASGLAGVTLALALAGPANAAPATHTPASVSSSTVVVPTATSATPDITPAQWAEAYQELSTSNYPRTTSVVDGQTVTTFDLNGMSMSFTSSPTASPGHVTPDLGGGIDSNGPYVSFNRVDQGALAVGAGAGLAVAICAIPAVGWVACAVVAAIIAAATYYVAAYGVCSNKKKPILRVYVENQHSGCYAS